jgi:hypothetical protein
MTPLDSLIVGLIALLLFGNRLPSVRRPFGHRVIRFNRDDPPTASGIFARIKPRPSGGRRNAKS